MMRWRWKSVQRSCSVMEGTSRMPSGLSSSRFRHGRRDNSMLRNRSPRSNLRRHSLYDPCETCLNTPEILPQPQAETEEETMSQARVSVRRFLETGLAMPVTGSLLMEQAAQAATPGPSPSAGIYQRLGIRTPLNA